jgi:putative transposase
VRPVRPSLFGERPPPPVRCHPGACLRHPLAGASVENHTRGAPAHLTQRRRPVSHPRRVVPGETYLITRRCYQRTCRLRPSAETNRIFLYCLAHAANRTGVAVHAVCVLSNHHHLVVTDIRGVLPDFLRELHRLTAKAMNASQGQWENLWAAEPCNAVRLVTDEDVEDKIAYVVTNPVAAGLVKQPEQWPGVLAWGEKSICVARPASYFLQEGTCPPEQTLRIERPRTLDGRPGVPREWRDRVARAIALKVAAAHRALHQAGREFLGRASVLGVSFVQRARAYEARFGVIPTFAAKARAVRDALRRVERYFRVRYRKALEQWRDGVREVEFPPGTWGMVVLHAAAVARAVA